MMQTKIPCMLIEVLLGKVFFISFLVISCSGIKIYARTIPFKPPYTERMTKIVIIIPPKFPNKILAATSVCASPRG